MAESSVVAGRTDVSQRPSARLAGKETIIRHLANAYHVENPRLFGSLVDGSETPRSDIDILVDPTPSTTLLDLGGLQEELEAVLGVAVDVCTPKDLPAAFRKQILAQSKPI